MNLPFGDFAISKRGDEMKKKYIKKIKDFAIQITNMQRDPLDGDQTEILSQIFNIELDFQNGNLKYNEDYDRRYAELNMEIL